MKRTPLTRRKGLGRRSTVRRSNPERAAKRRAEQFGRQAAWCRGAPCCVPGCGRPSVPAHVRSRGAGGKDEGNVVPLCWDHHTEQHSAGIRTFEQRYGIDLAEIAQAIWRELAGR